MKKMNGRFYLFLRRNALYLVLAFCILAVGLSVTLMLVNEQGKSPSLDNDANVIEKPSDQTPEQPEEPVINQVNFTMPVRIIKGISEYSDVMVWNDTLGRYSSHKAVDFFAEEGTEVLAVYDGTVKSVETTLLQGTTVTIDHGDGLITKYNSLADGESVVVGQSIKQGDIIGCVSVSNRQEQKSGAHLHFEVFENGTLIDPSKYLDFGEK